MTHTPFQQNAIERRKEAIANVPVQPIPFQGQTYMGKDLTYCDVVVKVGQNLYDVGLMNGDICKGLYELEGDKLIVRRLTDGHEGIVRKANLRIPVWEPYQY